MKRNELEFRRVEERLLGIRANVRAISIGDKIEQLERDQRDAEKRGDSAAIEQIETQLKTLYRERQKES